MNLRTTNCSKKNYKFLSQNNEQCMSWVVSKNIVEYEDSLVFMQSYVDKIAKNEANELVWLLEHPPLYTAGTSAKQADLLDPNKLPVYYSGRGGQYTYHGPGQRVAYIMLNLKTRKCDIRAYVAALEQWIINSLREFNIIGERREDRVGVWLKTAIGEEKIAAIGIRLHKWVSYHGVAINFSPNLENYNGIIACGQKNYGITSFAKLGIKAAMSDLDVVLRHNFEQLFGKTIYNKSLPTMDLH